ncbi:MAG: hypothetical protein IJ290_04045 [Bacteroidaceae bacterium]|nr:hypothetical protein [Bacteroidaceae bacterium]
MLQLTIDGQRVNLDPDISLEIVKCNPFLTKIGEYTYDIDVDLRDPQNAKVYGHIDRLHATLSPRGRTATLMDGARVICRGQEVLLGIEGTVAKIQILAGNSNFNYLLGNDTNIRDLDFGEMPAPTKELANSLLTSFYPEANFGFPEMTTNKGLANHPEVNKNYVLYPDYDDPILKPQPFVLYYVEKIVELLGYKLSENYLSSDPRWKRLMIIDNIWSLKYADHLPDWTIAEFIDEVEKFFNCLFLYDSIDNSVKIVSLKSFYDNSHNMVCFTSSDIIDTFRRSVTDDSDIVVDYSNVRYNLPDGEDYDYYDLPDEVEKLCSIVDVDINNIDEFRYTFSHYDKIIYRDTNTGVLFAFYKESPVVNKDLPTYAIYKQVNRYKSVIRDDKKGVLELNIVPCGTSGRDISQGNGNGNNRFSYIIGRPSSYTDPEEQTQTVNELFTAGPIKYDINKRMEVCFYLGTVLNRCLTDCVIGDSPIDYSYSQSILTVKYWFDALISSSQRVLSFSPSECGGEEHMTLELDGEHGRVNTDFSLRRFDANDEYSINIRTHEMLNPMSLYNIDNRLFYCKDLRYRVENGELTNIVEGKFYPAIIDI